MAALVSRRGLLRPTQLMLKLFAGRTGMASRKQIAIVFPAGTVTGPIVLRHQVEIYRRPRAWINRRRSCPAGTTGCGNGMARMGNQCGEVSLCRPEKRWFRPPSSRPFQ